MTILASSNLQPSPQEAEAEIAAQAEKTAATECDSWALLYRPQVLQASGQQVDFIARPYQRPFLAALDAGGEVLALKARQLGFSTCCAVKAAHILAEVPGASILAISKRERDAKDLKRKAELAYTTAQRPNKPRLILNNLTDMETATRSRFIVETANPDAGRGFTGYWLIYDEFAFLPWQQEMWRAAQPTIEQLSNVCILSTPNGQGDEFERLYSRHADPAKVGLTGEIGRASSSWRVFRDPWTVYEQRTEAWKARQLEGMTSRDFAQEYDCSFLSSGENIFRAEDLQACIGLWPTVEKRVASRQTGGLDVAGEGRDETVWTRLDATAFPWAVLRQTAWDHIPGPVLQAEVEKEQAAHDVELAIDYTGVGYGIGQNLTCPHRRVTFTSGSKVTGDNEHQGVPRDVLISHAVQVVERHQVALNPEHRELLRALQTARWEKRKGEFVDRFDSWLLALWMAGNKGPEPPAWIFAGD